MCGTFFKRLLRDDRGATAVEYGLIVALIVIAMIVAMGSVGAQNNAMWDFVSTKVSGG